MYKEGDTLTIEIPAAMSMEHNWKSGTPSCYPMLLVQPPLPVSTWIYKYRVSDVNGRSRVTFRTHRGGDVCTFKDMMDRARDLQRELTTSPEFVIKAVALVSVSIELAPGFLLVRRRWTSLKTTSEQTGFMFRGEMERGFGDGLTTSKAQARAREGRKRRMETLIKIWWMGRSCG